MQNPRTEASLAAYQKFKTDKPEAERRRQFNFADETIVKEYEHWYIIKNRFPYDTMARVNDMLVSKRAVSTFKELNAEELVEHEKIMDELAEAGTYDAKIENFPQVQSVSKHVHIHLVCWHSTDS